MCVKGAQKKGRPRSVGSAFIIRAACYRQEFRPSVVAMADRMLITVWIMIFQVSLFFIGSLVKGFVFSLLALRPSNVMLNSFQHLSAEKDE